MVDLIWNLTEFVRILKEIKGVFMQNKIKIKIKIYYHFLF